MDEEFYVLAFNFNGLCVFEQKIMCACVCMCAQDCCAWRTLPEGNQAILCKSL